MHTINDKKCLASWAVFKRLCDDGHNIYEVLREFIKATIYRNGLRSFSSASLTSLVNSDYEFNLKTAVVAYAIKELALPKNPTTGEYECDPNVYSEEAIIDEKIVESATVNNEVLNGLFDYVEKEKGVELNDSEKESLIRSLIHYLLDNSYEDENSTVISAYILRCRKDDHLSVALSNILEGVVRYVGVCFDSPVRASSHWTSDLTIYLDTEILFHMAGFNGSLYKQLFDDFYELVDEINRDSLTQRQRKLINLRYFDYVQEEIDVFFERASDIIQGKLALNPAVTAMKEITVGCKTESEVAEKKGLFLALINERGIEPDDNEIDFYNANQHMFNLEDESIVNKFCKENNYKREKQVLCSLLSLSHINVLRQGKSDLPFEDIKYVLLTDNFITQKVAWMDILKKEEDRPLCTDLYFITNRLWYKLGKAFGNNVTPKVFDVISKAQIILSSKINSSVYSQFETLVERMDRGEVDSEGALEVLYQLRSKVKNPEEIDSAEEVDSVMISVGESDLRKYIEDAEYRKTKYQKTEEENERLSRINEQIGVKNNEISKENEIVRQENLVFRQENERVKQENEKVKAANTEKDAQLQEKDKLNIELQNKLKESREANYRTLCELHTKKKNDYVKKRKGQTIWQFILFVLFLAVSFVLAYMTNVFQGWGWPDWIKVSLLVVVSQILPLVRGYVLKIKMKNVWEVVFKKDVSLFEEEFELNNPMPVLEKE